MKRIPATNRIMKDGAWVMDEVKKLASNKWVWLGGAGLVALYFGVGYLSNASGGSSSGASNLSAASDPISYLPLSTGASTTGGSDTTATDNSSSTDLASLLAYQSTQAASQSALAQLQEADNYALGQQSIKSNVTIAKMNADVTNNADAVSAFQSAIGMLAPKAAQISGVTSLNNGTLSVDVVGLSQSPKKNVSLISGVNRSGAPIIKLPTGQITTFTPAFALSRGYGS